MCVPSCVGAITLRSAVPVMVLCGTSRYMLDDSSYMWYAYVYWKRSACSTYISYTSRIYKHVYFRSYSASKISVMLEVLHRTESEKNSWRVDCFLLCFSSGLDGRFMYSMCNMPSTFLVRRIEVKRKAVVEEPRTCMSTK